MAKLPKTPKANKMYQVHTLPAPEHVARDFGCPAAKSDKPVYFVAEEQDGHHSERGAYNFEPTADSTKTR